VILYGDWKFRQPNLRPEKEGTFFLYLIIGKQVKWGNNFDTLE
jgi:hypothetical protein